VVSVSNRPVVKRGGITFIIQSPVASTADLERISVAFIDHFAAAWPETSEEDFTRQKAGLLSRLRQSPKNLNEQSQRYWGDLTDNHLTFDSRSKIATQVESISKAEMGIFLSTLKNKLRDSRLLIFSPGKFEQIPTVGKVLASPTAAF